MLGRVADEIVGANAAVQLAANVLRYRPTRAADLEYWCRLDDQKQQLALIYATLLREPVPGTPEEMQRFVERHDRALSDPSVQVLLELMRTPRDPPQPWVPTHSADACDAAVRKVAPSAEEGKMRNAMVWMLHPDARAAVPLVSVGPIAALDTCPMDLITDWVNHSVGAVGRGLIVAAYWLDHTTRTDNEMVPVMANEVEFDDITQYATAMVQLLQPKEEGMILCNAARVSYRWPFAVTPHIPAPAALVELDRTTAFGEARAKMEERDKKLTDQLSDLLVEIRKTEENLHATKAKIKARPYTPETHLEEVKRLEEERDGLTGTIIELRQEIEEKEAEAEIAAAAAKRDTSLTKAKRAAKTAATKVKQLRAQLAAREQELARVTKRGQRALDARAEVVAYDAKLSRTLEELSKLHRAQKERQAALKKEYDELGNALGEAGTYADYDLQGGMEVENAEEENDDSKQEQRDGGPEATAFATADANAPRVFADAWNKAHQNWQVEQRAKGRFDPARLRVFLAAKGAMQSNRFLQVEPANDWHLNARVVFRCCVCERASWMFWTVPMADMLWYCGGPRCELLGEASASHALLLNTLFEARVQYDRSRDADAPMPEPTNLLPVSRRGQPCVGLPALDVEHRSELQSMSRWLELYTSDLRIDNAFLIQSALFGGKLDIPVDVERPSSLFAGWSITVSGAITTPYQQMAELAPPLTPDMMTFLRNMQTVEEVHVAYREGTLAEAMSDVPVYINAAVALPDAEMDEQRERKEYAEADTRIVLARTALSARAEPVFMDTETKEAEETDAQPMDTETKDTPADATDGLHDGGHEAPAATDEPTTKRARTTSGPPVDCLVLPTEGHVELSAAYWDARRELQTAAMRAFRTLLEESEAKGDETYKRLVRPQDGATWVDVLVQGTQRVACSAVGEEEQPFVDLMAVVDVEQVEWNALLIEVSRTRTNLLRAAWDQWHDHVEQVNAQLRDAEAALKQARDAHGADHERVHLLEQCAEDARVAHEELRLDTGLGDIGAVSVAMSLRISSDARLTWFEYAREARVLPMDPTHEDYALALSVHAYQRIAASRVVKQRLCQPLPPAAGFSPRRVLASWLSASQLTKPVDTEAKFQELMGSWTNLHRAAAAFGTRTTLNGLVAAEAERRADASGADPRIWVFSLARIPCFSVEHGQRLVQCARDTLETTQDINELPITLPVQLDADTRRWLEEELTAWRTERVTNPGARLWSRTRPFLPFAIAEPLGHGQPRTVVDLSLLRHTGVRNVRAAVYLAHLGNWALHRLPRYSTLVARIEQQTPLVEPHASLALFRLRGVMPLRLDVASMIVGAGITVMVAQVRHHTLPFQPLGTVPVVSRVPDFPDILYELRIDAFQARIQAAHRVRIPTAEQDITVKHKKKWNATLRHMLAAALPNTHDPLALFAPFGITDETEALTVIDAGLYWLRQTSAWWSDPQWKLSERAQLTLVSRLARVGNPEHMNNTLSAFMLHQDAVYTNQPHPVRASLLEKAYERTKAWIKSDPEYVKGSSTLLAIGAERVLTQLLEARMLMISETLTTNIHSVVAHFSLVSRRDPGLDITALARAYAPEKLEPNFVNYLYALQYMFVSADAATQWARHQGVFMQKVTDPVAAFLNHRWDVHQLRALMELTPESATALIHRFENKDPLLPRLMRYRRVDALPEVVQEATNAYVRELYRVTETALRTLQELAAQERVPTYLSHWYLTARNARDAQAITNAVRWCMEDPEFTLVPLRLVRIVVRHYLSIEESQRMGRALMEAEELAGESENSSDEDDEEVEWDASKDLEVAMEQMRAPRRFRSPGDKNIRLEEAVAFRVVEDTRDLARLEHEKKQRQRQRDARLKQLHLDRKRRPRAKLDLTYLQRFVQNQTVEKAWVDERVDEIKAEELIPPIPESEMTDEQRAKWEKKKRLFMQRTSNRVTQQMGEVPTLAAREFDAWSEYDYENEMQYENEEKEVVLELDEEADDAVRSPKGEETPSEAEDDAAAAAAQERKSRLKLPKGRRFARSFPAWARTSTVKRAALEAPKLLGMRALAAMSEADYTIGEETSRATAYRMRSQTVDPLTLFELGRGINAEVPLEWTAWPPPELAPGSGTSEAMREQIRERLERLLPIYRKRAYDSLWSYGGIGKDAASIPTVDLRPWTSKPREMAPQALAWGALRMLLQAAQDTLGPPVSIDQEMDEGATAAPATRNEEDTKSTAVDSSDDEAIGPDITDEDQKEAVHTRNIDRGAKRRLRAFQRTIDKDEALAADRMSLFLAEDNETVPQLALLNLPPVPLTPDGLYPLLIKMIPSGHAAYYARVLRLLRAVLGREKGKFMATLRRASRTWLRWTRDEFGLRKSDLIQPFPPPDKGSVTVRTPEIADEVQRMQKILENNALRQARTNDAIERADRDRRTAANRWMRAVAEAKGGGAMAQAVLDPQERTKTVVDFLSDVLKPTAFLLQKKPVAVTHASKTWLTAAYERVRQNVAEGKAPEADLGSFERYAGTDTLRIPETLTALSRSMNSMRRQSAARGFDVVTLAHDVAAKEQAAYDAEDRVYSQQYCDLLRTSFHGSAADVVAALARGVEETPRLDLLHETQRLEVWSRLDALEAGIRAYVMNVPREDVESTHNKLHYIGQDAATTTARHLHRFALSHLHLASGVEEAMAVYTEAARKALIGTAGLTGEQIEQLDSIRVNFATPEQTHQRMVLRSAFAETMIDQLWPVVFPQAGKQVPKSFKSSLFRGLYMENCMALMQHMYDTWKRSPDVTPAPAILAPFTTHAVVLAAFESYKLAVATSQAQIAAGIVSDESMRVVTEMAAKSRVAQVISRLTASGAETKEDAEPPPISGPSRVLPLEPPPPLMLPEAHSTPMPLPWFAPPSPHPFEHSTPPSPPPPNPLQALVDGMSRLRMAYARHNQ